LIIWTSVDSGKAKRLRQNPLVRFGPSNHSGKLLGTVVEGQAAFVAEHEAAGLKQAFQAKYGWLYGLLALIWKLQRQAHTYIQIAPLGTPFGLNPLPVARADALHPVSA
jgi:PPOX class probable F420-dependent enzyme